MQQENPYYIALCYRYGEGGYEQNEELAFEWFKKSAELGNLHAQYSLGVCYYNGEGCEQNDELAFEWFKKCAQQDHLGALLELSRCYEHGLGCDQNTVESFRYYKKWCDIKNPNCVPNYASVEIQAGLNKTIDQMMTMIETLEKTNAELLKEVKEQKEIISELEITVPLEGGLEYQKAKQRFDELKKK